MSDTTRWLVFIAMWLAAWLAKRWELRIIEQAEHGDE